MGDNIITNVIEKNLGNIVNNAENILKVNFTKCLTGIRQIMCTQIARKDIKNLEKHKIEIK